MTIQAADQHKKAAEHHEQAAHQHKEGSKDYEAIQRKKGCPRSTSRMAPANRRSIMGLTGRSAMSHIMGIRSGAMKDRAYGVDILFAQIAHAGPSTSRQETPLIPVCCLCRLIRDESGPSLDRARWVTQRTYRKTHGVNPADCLQTHTYCPWCFTQVMETIRAAQVMETLAVA